MEDQLRSVAELKVAQLVAWQRERQGDASMVASLPGLAETLTQMAVAPGSVPPRLAELDRYLQAELQAYDYHAIHLLDRSLRLLRSYPAGQVWDGVLSPQNREELLRPDSDGLRPDSVLLEDLHAEGGDTINLDLLVRVRSASGEIAGVVVLTIQAKTSLFPLVQSWPVESATAETLLVRREGEGLRSLSPLRFKAGAELSLALPLSTPDLLAANALRAGAGVLVQGQDYRGEPVVGLGTPVPHTPWTMISKMDQSEAYANAWTEFWRLSAGLVFLLLVLVLSGRLWLHHQQSEHISHKLESERKRRAAAERLAIVMRHANDVIFLFDESMRIVDANERAVAAYGYTLPELRQLTAADLRAAEAGAEIQRQFAAAQKDDGFTFETVHRRKQGATFPVEVSSRPVVVDGRHQVLSIIREISERKAHEREIERLNRLYLVISEVNQALVRAHSRERLFGEVSRVLVERGNFRIAWIGWLNAQTRFIEPVAVAGDTTGYTQGIRISADPALPEGRGPSGTAFRENRVYITNDFLADPNTMPWRERAATAGFNATIALPLQQEGVTLGLLTVYAVEKDFFQAKEIELLKETAGDISFALEIFARERRRQTAEAALQASESRLQFLMSATPAIIYSLRAGGNFATTFLSPNIRNVLGYEPGAVIADPGFWPANLHPDDAAVAASLVADLESKSTISREYRFRHADGSWRWMHDEMRVTRDAEGRATELVGYWFDITERKAAEESLKAREEIFSSIVGQAADAITLVEVATGKFLEFNRAAHEGLGYSREEFAAFRIGDIQAEHSTEEIRRNIGLILEQGGTTFESRHRCRDSSVRDVRVSAKPLRLRGRDCIAAVWSDITEAKRAATELRKLSLAVEQSPATIVITNLAGAIEYVNRRFTELTGYVPAEVIGRNPRVLKSGLTAPEVYADLWRTISQGKVWRGEIVNRKKDGEIFVELCLITPVTDAQGRATHYVALKEDITERLKTEKRLRQLSRTIEQAPLSVAITDLSGAIEYVNPAFLAVTGYAREEVLGKNPRVLQSGLTPPATYVEMWQTLTRGEVWRGELSNRKKNGDIYQERAVIAPVTDEAGKVTHYVALKEDITERKRAESALHEVQERYRLIAENTGDVIWLFDLEREQFTYLSPSLVKLLGFTPEEMLGQTMRPLLTPAAAEQATRIIAQAVAAFAAGDKSAGAMVTEIEQQRKDGSTVATEVATTLLTGVAGSPLTLLGITRDITERKRANEALRRSEELYRLIADNTSDAIWIFDLARGTFAFVSPAAERLLGLPVAEMIGQPITMALTPESAAKVATDLPARIAAFNAGDTSRRDHTVQLDYVCRDGRTLNGEVVTTLLADAEGRVTRMLGVTRDITARKQAEDALRENEQRYRELFDLESDAILLLEADSGRIIRVNEAASILYGWTVAEFEQMRNTDISAEPDLTLAVIRPENRQAGGIVHVPRRLHRRRDGTLISVEITLRFFERGGRFFVLSAIRDITARLQAEEVLRQSRDSLTKAEQIARLGNWSLDLVTGEVIWSEGMYRVLELDPATAQPSVDLYHSFMTPPDRETMERRMAESLVTQRRFVLASRLVMPDGRIKYVEGTGESLPGPEGKPQRAIGTVQDVTDRKLVEIELHELVKGLRSLHHVSQALEQRELSRDELLDIVAHNLAAAMTFPDDARAVAEVDDQRVVAGADGALLDQFSAPITINGRPAGRLTVGYVGTHAPAADGPFQVREREVLESIARALGLALSEREAFAAAQQFSAELEDKVAARTAELARRNREVQALLESIPDMVLRLRSDGSVVSVQPSRESAELTALAGEQQTGGQNGLHPQLLASTLAIGQRALATAAVATTETVIAPGEKKISVELRAAHVGVDDFVVFARDITERRRLEDELRTSTDRLRLATQAGGVGVWEFFPDKNTLVWDDQMFALYGSTKDRFSGAYDAWQKGLHPDDRQRTEDELQGAIRGGKEFNTEFRVVWPDGSIHDIRARALVRCDGAGRVVQMIGTNWDITAQKHLESEAKAMLEKERQVSEMKTRFISVTSHEFRTPMAAALGSADLLANHLERFAPAKRQQLLGRISTSLQRMTAMLDDVLLLNRMDANRVEMNLAPVSLRHQLHSFIEEIRLGDRDAHAFDFQVSGEEENFSTDPNLLHHIVSNLLSNAVRYSPAGSTVTVCLVGGPEQVRLSVQDQGIGIPENDRARIFEPFERGSNVGNIKGTGLGLNIVKRMTEMLGGTIAVEPVAPTGSRFLLILPRLPKPPPHS